MPGSVNWNRGLGVGNTLMSIINQIVSSASPPTATVFKGSWITATDYNKNQQVTNNGDLFLCTVGHTSDSTTQPGVGANWTDKWVRQVNAITQEQIDACAGTGTPSGTNPFVTADHTHTADGKVATLQS
jgi:hypothetical protein